MIQSEKPRTTIKSVSAVGTTAGMRAGPIRLHVPAPQIAEFRLESAPDSPSSFRAWATALEPTLRAHSTKSANASCDPDAPGEGLVILDHNGNKFSVRVSMALIFQKHAALVSIWSRERH